MKNIAVATMLLIFMAFGSFASNNRAASVVSTFRDIPGITQEEIIAIEKLQEQGTPLIYASAPHTELFERPDGTLGGFTVLFTEWLSELFGLEFVPIIATLNVRTEKLESGEFAFTTIIDEPQRREKYFMTSPIAQRSAVMISTENPPPPNVIRQERLPRLAFLDESAFLDIVDSIFGRDNFEEVLVDNEEAAYNALKERRADFFIGPNTVESAFDNFGDVRITRFIPMIFMPAVMAAQNPEYEAIISLVSKAMAAGADRHLAQLYRQGYEDYRKNKFQLRLTDEEREYMRGNPVVSFATQFMSYPVSFYNTREGKWEGIVIDILEKLTNLTGIIFERNNDHEPHEMTTPFCVELLENGTVHFVPYLIRTSNRRLERFLWSETPFLRDRYALLSKRSYPNIELNDIPFERIGFPMGTAFEHTFMQWFPNAANTITFPTTTGAFEALDRGEVDLIMAGQSRLAALTNFYEFSDYKANFLFDEFLYAHFVFREEYELLHSIIDKALPIINTERIVEQWMSRTYNIEAMRFREQRPWFVGVIFLLLCISVLTVLLLLQHRNRNKELERLVAQRTQEFKIASETKSRFLANMSHEIRTPMNSIIGFADLAQDGDIDSKTREYLDKISDNAALLLEIIDDILDISKIEAGKIELENIPFDINEVFAYCRAAVLPKVTQKGLTLKTSISPPFKKKLLGDPVKMRQVLLNMLSNSVKFTDLGSVELSVVIEEYHDRATLHFEVRDTGIGMNEEQIKRIFEPFAQADTSITRKYGGTGLGLSIAHDIVKMAGGDLAVESAPGAGCKFTFSVTFALANENDALAKTKDFATNERPIFYGEVLICEDNEMNRQVICEHLERVGVNFVVAQNGAEGIEIVRQRMAKNKKMFNLIFMDIHMPVMDGLQTASTLMSLGVTAPIVALTANVMSGDMGSYRDAGMVDALSKPFRTHELWSLLKKYLPIKDIVNIDGAREIANDEKMFKRLRLNFVKSSRDACRNIVDALETGNITLAHRTAHSLKSNAGQIGEICLRDAAADVEAALVDDKNLLTDEKRIALEEELESTIERLNSILADEADEVKPQITNYDEIKILLDRLEPMLKQRNPEVMNLLDDIKAVAGSENLVRRVENFEFKPALDELVKLRQGLES